MRFKHIIIFILSTFNSSQQCLNWKRKYLFLKSLLVPQVGSCADRACSLFSCSFWAGENVPSPPTERFQRLLFWPLRAPGSLVCHHDLWPLQASVLGGMSEMFTFSETDGVQVAPFFPIWDVFLSQVLYFYPFILSWQTSAKAWMS